MRILVIPHFGVKNLYGESVARTYEKYIYKLNEIAKNREEKLWFYVVLQKGLVGKEIFSEIENVTIIEEKRELMQFFEEVSYVGKEIGDYFSMRRGIYPVDVIITSKTGAATDIMKLIYDFRVANADLDYHRIPIIIVEDRAFGKRETHNLVDSVEFARRSIGYALAAKNLFMDEFEYEEAMEVAKDYLSGALYTRAKKSSIMYPGIETESIDKVIKDVKKRDKFTLFWGGRGSAQKKTDFVLRVYNKFYELGYDVDIVITTPHDSFGFKLDAIDTEIKKNSDIKIYTSVSREQYLKMMASSHVFLSGSLYEGFTIGHTEAGYVGIPVIVPNRPWSRLIFGEDYKLMYTPLNEKEALAMLIWVYENYDEAQKIAMETRKRIKQLYDMKETIKVLYDVMKSEYQRLVIDKFDASVLGKQIREVIDLVVKELKMKNVKEATLNRIFYEMRKYMNVTYDILDPRLSMPSLWTIYQYMKNNLKCNDKYNSENPVFEIDSCEVKMD